MDRVERGGKNLNLVLSKNPTMQGQEGQSARQDQGNGSRSSDGIEDGDPLDM